MTQVQGSVVWRAVIDMLALALTDTRRARNAPRMLKAGAEALIADRCGYSNKRHLIEAFRDRFAATPDDIRAASGEDLAKFHEHAARTIMDG